MSKPQKQRETDDTGYHSSDENYSPSEAATEDLPQQTQNAALVRQQQQLQHQRDRKPGILSEDFYSTFEQRGPSAVDYARKQAEKQIGGAQGLEETLRLRLDLNLDLEVRLRAHVHGDLTLALLYDSLGNGRWANELFLGGEMMQGFRDTMEEVMSVGWMVVVLDMKRSRYNSLSESLALGKTVHCLYCLATHISLLVNLMISHIGRLLVVVVFHL